MVFPALKLVFLVVKQAAKPMARPLAERAKTSPFFRKCCIVPAQWYHRIETKGKFKDLGLAAPSKIASLDEEQAVKLGTEMLVEGFVLVVATSILLGEYYLSSEKEEAKKNALEERFTSLEDKISSLERTIESKLSPPKAKPATPTKSAKS